jgi:hypothetical protein
MTSAINIETRHLFPALDRKLIDLLNRLAAAETGTGKRQSKPVWGSCFGGTRTQNGCSNGVK